MSFMLERNGPENDWDPGLKNAARNLSCLFTWTLKNGFSFCMGKWTVSIIHWFPPLPWYCTLHCFLLLLYILLFLHFVLFAVLLGDLSFGRHDFSRSWWCWLIFEETRDSRHHIKPVVVVLWRGPLCDPEELLPSAETINYVSQGGKWASCSGFRVGQGIHARTKHTVSVWCM